MERRFHSPYRHWLLGLCAEIGVFVSFVAFCALLALVASWVA